MLQNSQIFHVLKLKTKFKFRYSRDIQSDSDSEEKIPYMQTFRFIKVKRYHEGNENQRKVCIYGIFSS